MMKVIALFLLALLAAVSAQNTVTTYTIYSDAQCSEGALIGMVIDIANVSLTALILDNIKKTIIGQNLEIISGCHPA